MLTFLLGPPRRYLLFHFAWLFLRMGFQAAVAEEDVSSGRRSESPVGQMLQSVREQYELPGLIAARIDGGRLSTLAAVGQRKRGAEERITPRDLVHLGSCTKAMTATLLALLVQENRIQWESTVGEVLPELRKNMHPAYRQVTVRQLLTHSGGLPAHDERIFQADSRLSPTQQRRDLFAVLLTVEPVYPPGSRHDYSNLGYMLAGLMAETVTGQSWEQLMRARLFRPLRMVTAGFGPPGTPGRVDQPWGHRADVGWQSVTQAPRQSTDSGAGRDGALQRGRLVSILGVASEPSAEAAAGDQGGSAQLHKPVEGSEYVLGWIATPRTRAHGRALTHAGSNTMWFAVVWLAPNRDFGVLAVTNSGQSNAAQACDEVVAWLIRQSDSETTSEAPRADDRRFGRLRVDAPLRFTDFPFRAALLPP